MSKSKHLTVVFLFTSIATSLMLWDYAMMQPTFIMSALPAFFSGVFGVSGIAHVFDLIKMFKTKENE